MKVQKYLYLYLALWLVFPCVVFIIWMSDYDLLIGSRGTAFLIQRVLNCIAAACGMFLAFWHYRKTENALKTTMLPVIVIGITILLICWNFLCAFLDGTQEYHSFTSPDRAHTIVIMENVGGISGQVVLYERLSPFLIAPRGHVISDDGYRPVCAGEYALVWDGDTVSLSVSDRAGGRETLSAALGER